MHALSMHRPQPAADLAARLTDAALAIVAEVGMPGDSVETELKLWHTLRGELERNHSSRRALQVVGEGTFLNRLVHRAARLVVGESPMSPTACLCPA